MVFRIDISSNKIEVM